MPKSRIRAPTQGWLAKQSLLTDRIADLALEEGLAALGVTTLASRLGTSDRMLIYYFGSKSDLVRAVFARISERQSALLGVSAQDPPRAAEVVMAKAWTLVTDARFVPYMRIWTEVTSRGTRGESPYQELAQQTNLAWLSWLESRLALSEEARALTAKVILAVLEGATLLEMSRPGSSDGLGPYFVRAVAED